MAYVRGEENLKDWRPRSSSLIDEHFKHQTKLGYIQQVSYSLRVYYLIHLFYIHVLLVSWGGSH